MKIFALTLLIALTFTALAQETDDI